MFALPDRDDNIVTQADYEGKTLLVVFWASWCGYCNAEIDDLNKIHNDYANKNVVVLGVSLDETRSAWLNKVDERGIIYDQVIDTDAFDADFAVACRVNSIPKMVLCDGTGKVLLNTTAAQQVEVYLETNGY